MITPVPARADTPNPIGRAVLLLSTALTALPSLAVAQPAPNTRPAGGQVVAGQASIAQTQARTTVSQSSQRAAIDWKSFDVGSAHTVQFAQPNSSAVTLNRVTGPNPSEIAGRIEANGQVVIINQAGVLFHQGAQVDTAGLVATASGMSTGNFMAGKMVFDQDAKPGAKVENRGTITIRERGLAALVAPQVANSGVVRATMGTVMLAGAEAHTIDLYGDGMVAINVTRQVRSTPDGTKALVTNTGTIEAHNGSVVLTAEAVDGVVQTLVNAGGVVRAGGTKGRVAVSGRGGDVIVTGTMAADGLAGGETGGSVVVNTTGRIALSDSARITASGPAGGGTVAIGTNQAGGAKPPAETLARSVLVSPGATIAADAGVSGRGGIVTILSADVTRMEGAILARGITGGGFVEVSGGRVSSATGRIDVSSLSGTLGTILIDPDFLDIVTGAAGSGSQDPFVSGGTILAGDASVPPDTVSTGVLNGLAGNVLLQANKTISVKGDLSLTNAAGQSLVLQAGGTITVDAGVGITAAGDVTLATGGAGPPTAPTAQATPLISVLGTIVSNTGTISLLAGTNGSISVGGTINAGTTLALTAGTGGIALNTGAVVKGGTANLDGGTGGISIGAGATLGMVLSDVSLTTTGGGVTQDAAGVIRAATLRSGGIVGSVSLGGTNTVAQLAAMSVSGANAGFSFSDRGTNLRVIGTVNAPGSVSITHTGTGALTVARPILAGTTLSLTGGDQGIAITANGTLLGPTIRLQSIGSFDVAAGGLVGQTGALLDINTAGVTQAAGGTLVAGTLQSSGGIAGGVALLGTANAIAALGSIAATDGQITLVNSTGLTVAGAVTSAVVGSPPGGPGITIAAQGPITLTAGASLGGATTTVDLGTSAGGVTQDAGSAITAKQMLSTGGIAGSVTLAGTANAIGALGSVAVSGTGADFLLNNSVALNVAGPVSAPRDVRIGATALSVAAPIGAGGTLTALIAGTIDLNAGAVLTAPRIALTAQGAIALASGSSLGQTGASIDLSTSAGGITQSAAATLIAGTLASPAGVTGSVTLSGTANAIGTLAAFAVSGGAFALNDTGDLAITGTVTASGAIGLVNSGTLSIQGRVSSDTTLFMTTTAGIDLAAGAVAEAGTIVAAAGGPITVATTSRLGKTGSVIDLSTTSGGVIQETGGTVIAASLASTSGVAGDLTLIGSNTIAAIGSLGVGGAVRVLDQAALALTGRLSSGGDAYLRSADPSGIAIAATGGLVTAGAGRAGLHADAMQVANGATLVTGQFEYAPFTTGATLTLGTGVGGLNTLVGINAARVTIGGVTVPGGGETVTAGAITTAASFDANGRMIRLLSLGVIDGTSAPIVNVATLTGSAVGTVDLAHAGNVVTVLDGLTVSGVGADLRVGSQTSLTVQGTVTATRDLALSSGSTMVIGDATITAGRSLTATASGAIDIARATLTAPSMRLSAAGPVNLGTLAEFGQPDALLDLSTTSGGITQHTSARIRAGRLTSATGITGDLSLTSATNAIGTISAITASGGIDIVSLGTGVVAGVVSAGGDISLRHAADLTVVGTIQASGTVSTVSRPLTVAAGGRVEAADIRFHADGAVTLQGNAVVGQAGAIVLLDATDGAITQAAAGTLMAARLNATATGSVTLAGTANQIQTLGTLQAGAADATLVNTGALRIEGPVSAPGAVGVSLLPTGDLTVAGSITAGTTITLVAGKGGLTFETGAAAAAAGISLTGTGAITFADGVVLGQAGATLALTAGPGGISQHTGARLIGNHLAITTTGTGNVILPGTLNAIGTLDDVSVAAGNLTLVNTTRALVVAGRVSATDIAINAGGLAIGGTISAGGDMRLTSTGTLLSTGTVTAANALTLVAGGTLISLDGVLHAGGSLGVAAASGDIALGGVIGTDSGNVTITAGGSLAQTSGSLKAAGTLGISAGAQVTLATVIEAGGSARIETPANLTIPGRLTVTGNVTLDVGTDLTTAGTIVSLAGVTLLAGTSWLSSGTVQAGAGGITATVGGPITQGAGLLETNAGGVVLTIGGGFPLVLNGTVIAGAGLTVNVPNGLITVAGTIIAGAGSTVFATANDYVQTGGTLIMPVAFNLTVPGSITQSAGTIIAPTISLTALTGSVTQSSGGALLSADSGGRIDISAAQRISLAGQLRAVDPAVGDVTLVAAGGGALPTLTQNGTILAGRSITQTALTGDIVHGGVAIADTVTFPAIPGNWTQSGGLIQSRVSPFALAVPGAMAQSAGASIIAPASIGITAATGIAQGGTLSTPGGTVSLLTQAGSLSASGAITAGQVRLTNPAGQIDVSGLITGLAPAALQAASQYAVRAGDFPTLAQQTGVFITAGSGEQNVNFSADIAATTGRGQVLIDIANNAPAVLNVDSPNADLFVALRAGPGGGVLRVGSLHVRYQGKGTSETVDFAGMVNGLSGYTAASASFVLPSLSPNYQLNGCAIQSASCFQISDVRVPVSNPLKDVQTGGGGGGGSVQFILPDVAERDY